jgi:hypothetical protein
MKLTPNHPSDDPAAWKASRGSLVILETGAFSPPMNARIMLSYRLTSRIL